MPYRAPGNADPLTQVLLDRWNNLIIAEYERQLSQHLGSRFFKIDPGSVRNGEQVDAIHWFANPAEPEFCMSVKVAQQLSDWGARGRSLVQNEYCEYAVIYAETPSGRRRPKRIEVTTELREYWIMLAEIAPKVLRAAASEALGFEPKWRDLYGVTNPNRLTPSQRRSAFIDLVAGGERVPSGALNTQHALFMTHTINGLDDLIYIVMFGAKPYASNAQHERATREQIFVKYDATALACRHADPAAAMGAYAAVYDGKEVAFADPLGMYIRAFAEEVFLYEGERVPKEWVNWGRGESGMYQRLVFGPRDSDAAFLDDIMVATGEQEIPLTGGYQLVQQLEVGPLMFVSRQGSQLRDEDWEIIDVGDQQIICSEAAICNQLREYKAQYDRENPPQRIGPRRVV
jgi:hypothetical protein